MHGYSIFVAVVPERSWHRIIAASAPGMATKDAANGKPEAFYRAVLSQGLDGILRTGWGKTTCRWGKR